MEDIHYGKVRPGIRVFMPHSKYAALVDQAARLEDEITAKVLEDVVALFQLYATTCSEINNIACLEDFKSGVRLAVRFTLPPLTMNGATMGTIPYLNRIPQKEVRFAPL